MAPKRDSKKPKSDCEKCPTIAAVTDDVQELSYDDKLKLIEKEATSLYEFCVGKGFQEKQLDMCISNFRGSDQSGYKKVLVDSTRSFVILGLVVAVISVVYASPAAYNMFTVHAKLFSMKVRTLSSNIDGRSFGIFLEAKFSQCNATSQTKYITRKLAQYVYCFVKIPIPNFMIFAI